MPAREVNFDGIVGPTHNYAGLSFGNLASTQHEQQASKPREAALQGLAKMKFVHDLGVCQAVLPPQRRPRLDFFKGLGFSGKPSQITEDVYRCNPSLLAAGFSASNMWTANAATVSPSIDCSDGKMHMTPANLVNGLHRSIESTETTQVLRAIFHDEGHFVIHDPLPGCQALSDEGAANHTRLCENYDAPGVETFVYGRSALNQSLACPQKFPARQTLEASRAIARRHLLKPQQLVFMQQTPRAIDGGVFHNDVISVGNQNLLLFHEAAFTDGDLLVSRLQQTIRSEMGWDLQALCLSESELPLPDAVQSYLFNSQLISLDSGAMALVCPSEVQQVDTAFQCTQRILEENNPVEQVHFLDLRQSMNNGGGPACLRLRVVMTEAEMGSIHQSVLFNDALYARLQDWVKDHYREELKPDDLRDPALIEEVDVAFHELSSILELPPGVFRF